MIKDLDEETLQQFMDAFGPIAQAGPERPYTKTQTPIGDSFMLRAMHRTCPCCGQPYCQRWYP